MFYGDRRLNLRIINNLRTSSKHTAEVWLHLNHKTSLVTRSNWKSLAMGFLSNPPRGFVESVAMLNAIPQGALAEMAQDVIAYLQYQVGFINTEEHEMSISRASLPIPINTQNCINALIFIFKSAASEKASVEDFTAEVKGSSLFKKECATVLREVWRSEGSALLSQTQAPLSVGELVSMDWKVGVATGSSDCKSLNAPYVSLQLKVSESQGQAKTHNVEMSLPEFQNFATQLREMSNALETV